MEIHQEIMLDALSCMTDGKTWEEFVERNHTNAMLNNINLVYVWDMAEAVLFTWYPDHLE